VDLRLTMNERKVFIKRHAKEYRQADKRTKTAILQKVVQDTGYHRTYAALLLRTYQTPSQTSSHHTKRTTRRKPTYTASTRRALHTLWQLMDCPCGKRMKAMIPLWLPKLQHQLHLDEQTIQQLHTISAATIDRLLREHKRQQPFARKQVTTKPGTLLKSQIPIRTFADWNEKCPGFMEADLVAHIGASSDGECCYTLNLTDVYSGWVELEALPNKAQVWTVQAIERIRTRLPFPLLGIDSDNGSEFINAHLLRYCQQHHITFTRARAGRKNDSCYVEQKHYTAVRQYVGYARFEGEEAVQVLGRLYAVLGKYLNFFQSVMRCREKVRHGSKVTRRYGDAQTPVERLLASEQIPDVVKARLRAQQAQLHPLRLREEIARLLEQLEQLAVSSSGGGSHSGKKEGQRGCPKAETKRK